MATNALKPNDSPRRANVPREAPVPVPEVLAEAEPVTAPEPEPVRERRPRRPPAREARPRSSWSLFSLLDRVTSVDGLFREGLPVHYLPHLLFVMGLTLLYIGNTHYGNRMNRNIQRLKQETEDLRADYTTLKSDYMEASKQSEVARKVAAFGLVESSSPPFRITVPAGHLDAAELELMPVLTADTLAARAARDSASALRNDLLAGRKRQLANGADDAGDTGPEIIAPPQALDDADTTVAVARTAPTQRRAFQSASSPKAKRAEKTTASSQRRAGNDKPNKSSRVQKRTKQHKDKVPTKQPVRAHSR